MMLKSTAEIPRYTVRVHHRAKRLLLKITPFGDIEVVVPRRYSQRLVSDFVASNRDWIEKNLAKLAQRHVDDPTGYAAIPAEIALRAIGQSLTVHTHFGDGRPGVFVDAAENRLHVHAVNRDGAARLLQNWLSDTARQVLIPWLQRVSEELALPFGRVTVRGQRSRWGSCSAQRHLNINRNLLFLSPELVRYLFVHELCHTRHMNHSADFWRLVASIEPAYQRLERELYRATQFVPLWVHRKF